MGIGAFSLRPASLLFGHTASKESLSVFRLTVLFDLKLSPEHTEYVQIPNWRNADAALSYTGTAGGTALFQLAQAVAFHEDGLAALAQILCGSGVIFQHGFL